MHWSSLGDILQCSALLIVTVQGDMAHCWPVKCTYYQFSAWGHVAMHCWPVTCTDHQCNAPERHVTVHCWPVQCTDNQYSALWKIVLGGVNQLCTRGGEGSVMSHASSSSSSGRDDSLWTECVITAATTPVMSCIVMYFTIQIHYMSCIVVYSFVHYKCTTCTVMSRIVMCIVHYKYITFCVMYCTVHYKYITNV